MTLQRSTQISTSDVALAFVGLHLMWPEFKIDAITPTLLGAAAVPWLLPLFKSVEFIGGLKVEFRELQATERGTEEAGLLDVPPDRPWLRSTRSKLLPITIRTWFSPDSESRSRDGWRVRLGRWRKRREHGHRSPASHAERMTDPVTRRGWCPGGHDRA